MCCKYRHICSASEVLKQTSEKEFEELKEKTGITVRKLRKKELEELDKEEDQKSAELYQG